jgi:AraC-like DNA-binding protein
MSVRELRALLDRHVRPDLSTAIDGVRICKVHPSAPPVTSSSGTVLAVVAQGTKRLAFGDRVHEYRAGQYLVASIDLPVTGEFIDTGRDEPALGFGMTLEPSAVAELLLDVGSGALSEPPGAVWPGIMVSDASDDLLDAVVRLLRLLDSPWDRKALVPVFKREILWRLITGDQGDAVRQLGLADSRLNQITRSVRWIRENYARPFRVEEMAQLSGMSASAFHRHFQTATGMSPIQFQKHIRLQQARLFLANRPDDVTGVALRVGYDSPSQFSREYRRLFGAPPSRDAVRMRGGGGDPAAGALP